MTLRHVHRSGYASQGNLQEGSTAESLDTSRGDILVSRMIEQPTGVGPVAKWTEGSHQEDSPCGDRGPLQRSVC